MDETRNLDQNRQQLIGLASPLNFRHSRFAKSLIIPMQKEREHHYLKKAQAAYPDLPQGNPMAAESPDFLFQNESRVLGIEVTDFVRRVKRDSFSLI